MTDPRHRPWALSAAAVPAALLLGLGAPGPVHAAGPAKSASSDDEAEPPREPAPAAAPDDLVPPRLLAPVQVTYPEDLAALPEPPAGVVTVRFVVGTDGVPKEVAVARGVHPELDALAARAVAALRYEPATWKGRPVEIATRMDVAFEPPLKGSPEPPQEPPAAESPGGSGSTGEADGAKAPKEPAAPAPAGAEAGDEDDEPEGPPAPSGDAVVRGTVLRAGDRVPVRGAQVTAEPAPEGARPGHQRKTRYGDVPPPAWELSVTTAADGTFELPDLPGGLVQIVVLTPGYERTVYVEKIGAGEELTVRYFQKPESTNPYRTVVRTEAAGREEVTRRTITAEEITNLPGTQGDALKALQNFPGMARAPFGAGLLLVRGAAPDDSAVFLGYHEMPQLFHFGGLTSVFNSDILRQIDFIPGNFDSRYGDAIGGVVNVEPRKGRRDGYHGYLDSDLFDTGALFEGPVGKGSFVLSARRSYIDLLLPALIPKDAGLNATIAPRYWDYQALFDYPVGDGDLSVRVFGSDDRTKLVFADENDVEDDDRNRFETTTLFHRADLVYRVRKGPWEFLLTPSYRYDSSSTAAGGIFSFNLRVHTFSGRAEASRWVTRRLGVRVGTEVVAGQAIIDADAPPVPGDEEGATDARLSSRSTVPFSVPALYTTWTVRATDRLTFYPGLRVALYNQPRVRATVDPRLRASWQVADHTTLKAGVGLYSQLPSVVEWHPTWGNPRLAPERSVHTSLGVAQELPYRINLEVTGFYKRLWDMAAPSERLVLRPDGTLGPETFASTGVGRIYGAELLLRKELTRHLFGWVAYTLMRSERRDRPGEPFILTTFDQTHILTLVGVVKLPKHWQIGARFRLVSGNPYTPVVGAVFDASSGSYIPVNGAEHGARLPAFHQLDLRIDKRWIWRRLMLNVYLDIQNVYNRQNPEFVNYSFDYRERQFIPSLPIIPSLGLKLEF